LREASAADVFFGAWLPIVLAVETLEVFGLFLDEGGPEYDRQVEAARTEQ
jgi:hypothetical protein